MVMVSSSPHSTDDTSSSPLLLHDNTTTIIEGVVDYKGRTVHDRSNHGGWRSALFIIGVEIAERFSFYGISSNLITYLTDSLHQSTASAAANVNTWSGTSSMLPLLGAFIADSFLGRYRTILYSSIIYVLIEVEGESTLVEILVVTFEQKLHREGGRRTTSISPIQRRGIRECFFVSEMTPDNDSSDAPLPLRNAIVEGVVDYKGRTVHRSKLGGWRSASFIIGVEIAERFAFYGVSSNLITYLTGSLHQSTASAAANVNTWSGTTNMLPLLGAFIADSFLGCYRTILFASLLYVLGLGLLTLSAVLPSESPSSPSTFRIVFFFLSLYLVAVAQAGHKPCTQAFGADQFDEKHPEEKKSKSSFFNWWYFGLCAGTAFTILILNYVQDNLNWGLGFGIPCIVMAAAVVVFLLGTKTYRYSFNGNKTSPFVRIAQVFVAAARNWKTNVSTTTVLEEGKQASPPVGSRQFRFLNKALGSVSSSPDDSKNNWKSCSIDQVEEAKAVLRLVPIWATCLIYAVVFAQSSTFFTKQGSTMDRSIGNIKIPAASLQTFISISIVIFIPIYDKIFVPFARGITGRPSGITMLQRIGFGMFLSAMAMVVAGIVEIRRLQVAYYSGLIDAPKATVPMSVWWLVPQYVLFGIADVFTMVGLQEFFYDQVPNELRSLGLALYLSIFGVGSFISGFMVSAINRATGRGGRESWFSNNLNRAHLDYFYWILAGLSAFELVAYLYFAKSYVYNKGSTRTP